MEMEVIVIFVPEIPGVIEGAETDEQTAHKYGDQCRRIKAEAAANDGRGHCILETVSLLGTNLFEWLVGEHVATDHVENGDHGCS